MNYLYNIYYCMDHNISMQKTSIKFSCCVHII